MIIFLFGLSLFFVSIAINFILWRIRYPKRPMATLLFVFIFVLFVGLATANLADTKFGAWDFDIWEHLHIILFYVPLFLGYMITYAGLEDDSPSMTIVQFVSLSREKGREYKDFERILTDKVLIAPRIDNLLQSGMVVIQDERFILTKKGRLYARLFSVWLDLLNMSKGG
jgi:uncharacterized protein YacL